LNNIISICSKCELFIHKGSKILRKEYQKVFHSIQEVWEDSQQEHEDFMFRTTRKDYCEVEKLKCKRKYIDGDIDWFTPKGEYWGEISVQRLIDHEKNKK